LNYYEQGKPVFVYTGRGPSSESMHMGHMIPFEFAKYLQDAFGCIVVIQLSDDEKYYFKGDKNLDEYTKMARENIKDIIAVGFDCSKTYIFTNRTELGRGNSGLVDNIIKMMNYSSVNTVRSIFGLNKIEEYKDENGNISSSTAATCSIGMMSWPVFQSVPAFSNSFKFIFGDVESMCLVIMAVDQAPYFRLCRDFAAHSKLLKPAEMHSEFLVGLSGIDSKMSTTEGILPIFLKDDEKEITEKIKLKSDKSRTAYLKNVADSSSNEVARDTPPLCLCNNWFRQKSWH
jgi:tryptophanyl-tRNA synthetase